MKSSFLLFFFLFLSVSAVSINSIAGYCSKDNIIATEFQTEEQDTLIMNQMLYNGKVWIGLYYSVYGTEFLFSKEWISGDVMINGILFTNVLLKYDIYNDDLITPYRNKKVLILNKEIIDNFTLHFDNREFRFLNLKENESMDGYYQVYYDGIIKLYKKWRKKRVQFAIEARYDEFQSDDVLYLVKADVFYEISSKRNLLKLLGDRKQELKNYLKENRIRIDVKSPDSIIPVLEYYDNM